MVTSDINIFRATTSDDLKAVGALRHRCYVADGLIDPVSDGLFLDTYDYADHAQVFMVEYHGDLVASIRLHILDDLRARSATMDAFPDVLEPMIAAGRVLLDGARFVVDPVLGSIRLAVARQTLRIYAGAAAAGSVTYGVAAVQEPQIRFYSRIFGFRQIAEPRDYGRLNAKLALMGVDLRQHSKRAFDDLDLERVGLEETVFTAAS